MALTIEEAKAFKTSAAKSRENWFVWAKRSWQELKRRRQDGELWSKPQAQATDSMPTSRRSRYGAWYSAFKIRQPLYLSRVGIPIGRDTTQDGNDNIGATAAILLERLAINLAKSFDFFDVICSARDDFIATNFGQVRAYYERDEVKEPVKERLQPQQVGIPDENKQPETVFVDSAGNVVNSDKIEQDDEGYFIELQRTVDVTNEKICLEHVLYPNFLADSDIYRWSRCKRIIFRNFYSEPEFIEIFGKKAYTDLSNSPDSQAARDAAYPKKQTIEVNEYWDIYEKKCYWWAETGEDFIKPLSYLMPDDEEAEDYKDSELEERNGLYNLEKFFPCPAPLISNQSTDEFWPTPEFYQLYELLEDIHTTFSQLVAAVRAIRPVLLYDASIEGLTAALKEGRQGDCYGVTNLAQALNSSGGSLDGAVQYVPVAPIIEAINQLYIALEQKLTTFYKLTGIGDLLQGQANDQTQRTYGERQMMEKYALNQHAEPQRKVAEFVRSCYQLLTEMALKNFKDESLDEYIIPHTLEPEHQERYLPALALLKDNHKRFRIELETDSTIALNEEYDKQARIELVNTLTAGLEKVAGIAQGNKPLVGIELHALKYLIQAHRQGKLFQDEITQAIDNVIKESEVPQPPPFNIDEATINLKQQELSFKQQQAVNDSNYRLFDKQSQERLEFAKLSQAGQLKMAELSQKGGITQAELEQKDRLASIENQLQIFIAQNHTAVSAQELQLAYEKLNADITLEQERLATDRAELQAKLIGIADKKDVDLIEQELNTRVANAEIQLALMHEQAEQYKITLDEQEKYATEARLQSEHNLQKLEAAMMLEKHQREIQGLLPPVVQQPPKPIVLKKKFQFERDSKGKLQSVNFENQKVAQILYDEMGNMMGFEGEGSVT